MHERQAKCAEFAKFNMQKACLVSRPRASRRIEEREGDKRADSRPSERALKYKVQRGEKHAVTATHSLTHVSPNCTRPLFPMVVLLSPLQRKEGIRGTHLQLNPKAGHFFRIEKGVSLAEEGECCTCAAVLIMCANISNHSFQMLSSTKTYLPAATVRQKR